MTSARDSALAARWVDEERAAGRAVTTQMQRRVAGALSRGAAWRLDSDEAWRRLSIWSASRNLDRRRPPTPVLAQIVRNDLAAQYWEALLGEQVIS